MISDGPPRAAARLQCTVRATILVVDDNDVIRELLSLSLSYQGYQVLKAKDAIDAGALLRERHVDLLLTDIEMPSVDGLELLRALRRDRSTASIPVLVVSSHSHYEQEARQLGAAGYLTKPVRTSDLFSTVAQQLKAA